MAIRNRVGVKETVEHTPVATGKERVGTNLSGTGETRLDRCNQPEGRGKVGEDTHLSR